MTISHDSKITPLALVTDIDKFYTSKPSDTGSIEDFAQYYDKTAFDKDGSHNLAINPSGTISRGSVRVIDYILNESKSVSPKNKDYDELRSRFFDWLILTELPLNHFKKHPNFKILQGLLKREDNSFSDNVVGIIKARKKENLIPWVEEIVKKDKKIVSREKN